MWVVFRWNELVEGELPFSNMQYRFRFMRKTQMDHWRNDIKLDLLCERNPELWSIIAFGKERFVVLKPIDNTNWLCEQHCCVILSRVFGVGSQPNSELGMISWPSKNDDTKNVSIIIWLFIVVVVGFLFVLPFNDFGLSFNSFFFHVKFVESIFDVLSVFSFSFLLLFFLPLSWPVPSLKIFEVRVDWLKS